MFSADKKTIRENIYIFFCKFLKRNFCVRRGKLISSHTFFSSVFRLSRIVCWNLWGLSRAETEHPSLNGAVCSSSIIR